MADRIEDLESEIQEVDDSTLIAHGQDPVEDARLRRQELAALYDGWAADSLDEEEEQDAAKRQRTRDHPDIPQPGNSENLETVSAKLKILHNLKAEAVSKISNYESERKLNELANEDEDIDPFEAFMAENTIELSTQQIDKVQGRLDEINSAIGKFEKLESILSRNQFSDLSISEALRQRQEMERKAQNLVHEQSTTSADPRGTGTVWEDEFKKDESVPDRQSIERKPVTKTTAVPVKINPSVGGLHISGKPVSEPVVKSVSQTAESSQKRQEELRKKLGY